VICEDTAAPFTCAYAPEGRDVGSNTLSAMALDSTGQTATAYRVVRPIALRVPDSDAADVQATAKFLVGALVFVLWTLGLALAAGLAAGAAFGWAAGLLAAAGALVGAPALAVHTLRTAEGWRAAWRDARRFLRLRGRPARMAELRARQRGLAERLEAALRAAPAAEGEGSYAAPPRRPAGAPSSAPGGASGT
jgi:hypothetical protein